MAVPKSKLVSLSEVIEIAAALEIDEHVGGWFFRGQSDARWEPTPKGHRQPYVGRERFDFKFKMWLKNAQTYQGMQYSNDFEAMAIAQHHGFASKLLDWSSNILVATFFGCSENFGDDAILFAYFPTQYIYTDVGQMSPIEVRHTVGYQPKHVTSRLRAQSGCFTYHKEPDCKIQNEFFEPGDHDTLMSWIIPSKHKLEILEGLDKLAVNYRTLFPDLDGLSRHYCLLDEIHALKE